MEVELLHPLVKVLLLFWYLFFSIRKAQEAFKITETFQIQNFKTTPITCLLMRPVSFSTQESTQTLLSSQESNSNILCDASQKLQ